MNRLLGLLLATMCCGIAPAAEWGMKTGNPELKSAGPLAFGDNGVLFVGDVQAATVVALHTKDEPVDVNEIDLHVAGLEKKVASAVKAKTATINDLAVNPKSGVAYLSVSADDKPAIVRLMSDGEIEQWSLEKVDYSKVELPNAPPNKEVGQGRRRGNYRTQSITDLAFSDGKVLVSGVAGSDREANVRELIFPFLEADKGVNVEIYHGAHGQYENTAAVKAFVPFKIDGEPYLLAGFQCTPLVKFPLKQFKEGQKVRGTTLAELGNRNRPLDMIVYQQDGKHFLLISNNARGVMKVSTDDVERTEGITERVARGGTAGQKYETIKSLTGVEQMDRLNEGHVLVLARNDGSLDAHTVDLP